MYSDLFCVFNKNIFFEDMRRRSDEVSMELKNDVNYVEDISERV